MRCKKMLGSKEVQSLKWRVKNATRHAVQDLMNGKTWKSAIEGVAVAHTYYAGPNGPTPGDYCRASKDVISWITTGHIATWYVGEDE